ncbi:MAG: AMIN domain-containing protein [Deltaproteobacteria bacterium]|nr:AMIN domain-containing protein [Deltaproteobacteria bacterium]
MNRTMAGAVIVVVLGAGSAQAQELNAISRMDISGDAQKTTVVVVGSRRPTFQAYTQKAPVRVVVDLVKSQLKNVPASTPAPTGSLLTEVRAVQMGAAGRELARLEIVFADEIDYQVDTDGNALRLTASRHVRPGARPAQPLLAQAPAPPPAQPAPAPAPTQGAPAVPAAEPLPPPPAVTPAPSAPGAQPVVSGTTADLAAEKARAEEERVAREKAEKEAAEKARAEKAKAEKEAAEKARVEKAQAEKAAAEKARAEREQAEREAAEKARAEREAAEKVRAEKERAQREAVEKARFEKAKAERDAAERARMEKEQADRDAAERVRVERARAEEERLARMKEDVARAEARRERAEPVTTTAAKDPAGSAADAPAAHREREEVGGSGTAPPAPAPVAARVEKAPEPRAQEEGGGGGAPRVMTFVGFKNAGEQSLVTVRTSDKVSFNVRKIGQNKVAIELDNTRILLRNNQRSLDTSFFPRTAIKSINPEEVKGSGHSVRIVVELAEEVPFESRQEGNVVTVAFTRPAG